MMKYCIFILLWMMSGIVFAEDKAISLEKVQIDLHDKKSIMRGAKFFATNCMACHTLIYMRYDKIAKQAGITYEKMPVNVKSWPFGITPPDLSLTADARGVDWIYTYLHSFYLDPARPTGVNNLLIPNTAMSGILLPYQGRQVLATDTKKSKRIVGDGLQWYDELELQSAGAMTPKEFDATITDVVNFLAYASDPYYVEQVRIGYWVIGFLCILFLLTFGLKKEYWKDIQKKYIKKYKGE